MDLWFRNTYIAIFLTYLAERFYVTVKVYYQTKNFSRRTLIDEMFLI